MTRLQTNDNILQELQGIQAYEHDNPVLLYLLALNERASNNNAKANILLDTALSQHPNAPWLLRKKAQWLMESDQDSMALEFLGRALNNNKHDVQTLIMLAEYFLEAEKYETSRSFTNANMLYFTILQVDPVNIQPKSCNLNL